MGREEMRAGDGERQAVADQLKAALDEGRLDLTEYDERLQRTYAAKTYGDLDGLLDDLPGTVPVAKSQVQPAAPAYAQSTTPAAVTPSGPGSSLPAWFRPYLGVFLVCTVIWAITSVSAGHPTYYWPVWMLIPLIFGVLGQWRSQGGIGSDRDARRAARRDRRGR